MKIKLKNLILFVIVFVALFLKYFSMWNYLFVGKFETPIIIMTLFILVSFISILSYKIRKKDFKKVICLLIMGGIIVFINPKFDFLFAIIFAIIFSVEENGDEKFIKYYFINSLLLFICTILLYLIGILPSNNSARVKADGIVTRYSFGFAGINILFLCLIPIFASFMIYKKDYVLAKKLKVSFVIFLISLFFYKITLCRTGFLIAIILAILNLITNKISSNKYEKYIKYSYFILTIISIFLASEYLQFGKLNEILSNRLFFWNKYVTTYNIGLFDKSIITGFPLDNVYLTYLYIDGIIIFTLYIIINFSVAKKISKNKMISLMFISFSLYGIFENNYSYQYNFILILEMIYFIDIDKSQKLLKNDQ